MGRLTAHSEYSHTCPSDLARVQAGTEDQSVSPFSCFLWAARTGTAAAGKAAFPGHTFTHLSEGARQHQRWQCQTKGTSGSKREWSADKGEDWQAGECRGWSWLPAPCLSVFTIGGQGTGWGIVCLFCFCSHLFIYLFTFAILILSRFSQVKREWLWVKHTAQYVKKLDFDRCSQPKSISRNIWWTRNNASHPQFCEYFFKVERVVLNERNIKKRFSMSGNTYSECICWHLSRGSQTAAREKWILTLEYLDPKISYSSVCEPVLSVCVYRGRTFWAEHGGIK